MEVIQSTKLIIPLLGLALLQPGLVYAEKDKGHKQDNNMLMQHVDPMGEPITASILMGKNVKDKNGRDIGEVEELIVNRTGRITHAILSFGGFMGVGDDLIPVPWSAFELKRDLVVTPQDSPLTLAVSEETIKNAPRLRTPQYPLTASGITALDRANEYFEDKVTKEHKDWKQPGKKSG